MVEKVFWSNSYLREIEAKVTGVEGNVVTLDRTIIYPFSGGQESDGGTIGGYPVLKAEIIEGEIFYTLEKGHALKKGDQVSVKIDWDRRYKLMRLHFAVEIVLELVNQNYGDVEKIGAHISEHKGRLDFAWNGNISETFGFLQAELDRIVDADLKILSDFDDADKEIRYWQIESFAKVPCCGTHLKSTAEIGKVTLKRNNRGKQKERIEITLVE
ncbi:MAG: alanyl-tRNA editing protein [Firmicutes bacterium]|nr:alanyl-tRNA editing protein [Bacillota bacterium]